MGWFRRQPSLLSTFIEGLYSGLLNYLFNKPRGGISSSVLRLKQEIYISKCKNVILVKYFIQLNSQKTVVLGLSHTLMVIK